MVVGAFPIIKLATLAVRTISKPIAKRIEQMAKNRPFLRRYICMPIGQFHHRSDITLKLQGLGLGKAKKIEPLSEEAAVELGSSILSEFFLFSVAVGTITWEYLRQARKENTREEGQLADIDELQKQVEELGLSFEKQDAQMREIYRLVIAEPWRTQQSQQASAKASSKGADKSVELNELKKKVDQIGRDLQKQNAQIREMQKSVQAKTKP